MSTADAARYPVPAAEHRVRDEVQRSRFLTVLAPAPSVEAAQAVVAAVRAEFPEATHHCWAHVVGPPGSTARIGLSDDGEPHGTAGRPMLTALLHSGVGDIVAIVVRWYGGTKLGTGGLARAYAGGVTAALATLPTRERVARTTLSLRVAHGDVGAVRQLLAGHEATLVAEAYGAEATYVVAVPTVAREVLEQALRDATRGTIVVHEGEPPAG
jgi:uncharacterized YigZ family protein